MIVQQFKVKEAEDDWAELVPVAPQPGTPSLIEGVKVTHAMPAISSITVHFHKSASSEFRVGNTLALVQSENEVRERKPMPRLHPRFVKGA